MRRSVTLGLALVTVLSLAACTGEDPEPAPTDEPRPTGSATAEPDESVTVDSSYGGVPFAMTVHPVESDGERAVLTVDFTVDEDAPDDERLFVSLMFRSAGTSDNLGELRLVDLEESWVAWPEDETGGIGTTRSVVATPSQPATAQAMFAAPPGDTVDVLLPRIGLVPDVPVVDAGPDAPKPDELGLPADAVMRSASLETFAAAFDLGSQASVEGEQATVTLASDVLFATDEFVLTEAAAATVDQAAQGIAAAAGGGEVLVVGHTDDIASDDYNLELSRKRAAAVAERLTPALGSGFTVSTEGKGESEPAAEGTSPEARAANRRVEIRFTAEQAGAPISVSSASVPEPEGAVGSGNETVVVDVNGVGYEVAVREVRRRHGYLVGSIEVSSPSGAGEPRIPFVTQDAAAQRSRGFGNVTQVGGTTGVALAGDGSWVYPADYLSGDATEQFPRRQVLGDRELGGLFADVAGDGPVTVTVIWPDTGQDSVTVDVHGRFRITDVPVEDAA